MKIFDEKNYDSYESYDKKLAPIVLVPPSPPKSAKSPKRANFKFRFIAFALVIILANSAILFTVERRFDAHLSQLASEFEQEIAALREQAVDSDFSALETISNVNNEMISANIFANGMNLTQLFEQSNPAVVAIATEIATRNIFGQQTISPSAGSGFIISEDGYIVTNAHVLDRARIDRISVLLYDGTRYPAVLIGSNATEDLAVLKIEATGLQHLIFGDSETLLVGEQVAAIGNPLGELNNSMTVGVISALDREINVDGQPFTMLQTDAAINPGNSGGPLLNVHGQVIGVVTAKSGGSNVEGLGFAIPSNHAQTIVASIIDGGIPVGRPIMGVMVGEWISAAGEQLVVISEVTPNGAAQRAGLRANDIIRTINGVPIRTVADLLQILEVSNLGDTLTVTAERLNDNNSSNVLTVEVVLHELRPA
ncbi:MAG: trypsin-like peptidase domain-containing protein [Firmicutes bacterium]|nr:trypsin-like peptidase domain-containing protein [Bacillota bacterium]